MPLLQVRDFPEDIYKKISIVAKKQKRTIAQQVIVLLEKGLEEKESCRERRLAVLSRIAERNVSQEAQKIDAVALIREDRNR